MQLSIDFISLGCAKNLVDSERLMYVLFKRGYKINVDPQQPESKIVIINTCGFIADAKQESINTILQYVKAKSEGDVKKIYVFGCLSQRYREELQKEIPEVDGWWGKFDFLEIADHFDKEEYKNKTTESCFQNVNTSTHDSLKNENSEFKRYLTTPNHYAYLKIAEGCNRRCAYCIIPHITGYQKSRTKEEILQEVQWLISKGVKELQVIAQELTAYGTDITQQVMLPQLIDDIADIQGVEWIRLHYAYPNNFPWLLFDVINKRDNVCKYLDVALQHISNNMLKRMHRNTTSEETYDFIKRMRQQCPGIQLRTTLMVGFPGETEDDFQQLLDFVRWAKFERMGAFAYSEEEGTYSAIHYKDNVPPIVKQQRLDTLMKVQQEISQQLMEKEIGKRHRVIVDALEGDYYVTRNQYSSPEVDPEILIKADDKQLVIGQFYNVEIIDSTPFDLFGKII